MDKQKTICLLNDSFPPQIDGVANTILNYAREITASGTKAMVVTPSHPVAEDEKYSFPIIRYPSVTFTRMEGYMAGIPFSPEVVRAVSAENPTYSIRIAQSFLHSWQGSCGILQMLPSC